MTKRIRYKKVTEGVNPIDIGILVLIGVIIVLIGIITIISASELEESFNKYIYGFSGLFTMIFGIIWVWVIYKVYDGNEYKVYWRRIK